jgi:hypothetical protein
VSGVEDFFYAMAPILTANMLTIAFVYSVSRVTQMERDGKEDGRGAFIWLATLVLIFVLYGFYVWRL